MAQDPQNEESEEKPAEKIDLSKVQAPTVQPLKSSDATDSEKENDASNVSEQTVAQEDEANPVSSADEGIEPDTPQPDQTVKTDAPGPEGFTEQEGRQPAAEREPAPADSAVLPPTAEPGDSNHAQPATPDGQDTEPGTPPAGPGIMSDGDTQKKEDEVKAAEKAKHDAAIRELIAGKKYELPINSIERRKNKKTNKKQILIVAAALLLLICAWLGFSLATGLITIGHKTTGNSTAPPPAASNTASSTSTNAPTYMAAVRQFVSAIQKGDKAAADKLQSPAYSKLVQSQAGTPSFYAACKTTGDDCLMAFKVSYLNSSKVKPYTSAAGVKGEEISYQFSKNVSTTAGGTGGTTRTSVIDVVPSGKTWLVDNVNETDELNVTGNESGTSQ